MYFRQIDLFNFRNHSERQVVFTKGINCITGLNGSGKTNILDALHYLSLCKSYFSGSDIQNILIGEEYFILSGRISREDQEDIVSCTVRKGQKKIFKMNGEEYEKLSDHIGKFPLILVAPKDMEIISGGSEERRRVFDTLLVQLDHSYLENLIRYNRLLSQRNQLLKQMKMQSTGDFSLLRILSSQMAEPAEAIVKARNKLMDAFVPTFREIYQQLGNETELPGLQYMSKFVPGEFENMLEANENKDLALEYTSLGPHKDDFEFFLDQKPVKRFGSQGQQKTFLIALKLAEFMQLAKGNNTRPVLLLDDIFERLDPERLKRLMKIISGSNYSQVILTDSNRERARELLEGIGLKANWINIPE